MKNSKGLFSYAIVVIESLWPKLPEEAPRFVGLNEAGEPNTKTTNSYLYSDTQNAFSGYFKIIPLNIKSISINSTKEGHNFDINFDSSYVYVQFDPKFISPAIFDYIERNALDFNFNVELTSDIKDKNPYRRNFLSGVLEGYSLNAVESSLFDTGDVGYFLPGTIVSKFVNEMDTVSIFLVQDLDIFEQSELVKIAGGSFSRIREIEKFKGAKKLSEIGILKPSKLLTNSPTDKREKLSNLRAFLGNFAISSFRGEASSEGSGALTSFGKPRVYSNDPLVFFNPDNTQIAAQRFVLSKLATRSQEYQSGQAIGQNNAESNRKLDILLFDFLINLVDTKKITRQEKDEKSNNLVYKSYDLSPASVNNEIAFLFDNYGQTVSNYLKDEVFYKNTIKVGTKEALKAVQVSIENYYGINGKGGNPISSLLPWSLYTELRLLLEKYYPEVSSASDLAENKKIIDEIIIAMGLDLYFAQNLRPKYDDIINYYGVYNSTGTATNDYITEALNTVKKISNINFDYTVKDYQVGVDAFYTYVVKKYQILDKNLNSVKLSQIVQLGGESYNLSTADILGETAELAYPLTCETPYFVLNGHIGKITDSSSVNLNSASKTINISGNGYELPLKAHNIYQDPFSSGFALFKHVYQYALSNASPIAAALSILNVHMSEYVKYRNSTKEEANSVIRDNRTFEIYQSSLNKFIEMGNIVRLGPLEQAYYLFSPIHYVDKSYLRIIKQVFDTIIAADDVVLTENRTINDGSVYNNLTSFLGGTSLYSFFIDEFGTIKVRFESSAVCVTNSTILSPFITDKDVLSFSISSDQSEIKTLVEVVSKNLASGGSSGSSVFSLHGRALPPSIVDKYGVYNEFSFSTANNVNKVSITDVRNFIQQTIKEVKEGLTLFVDYWNKYVNGNQQDNLLKINSYSNTNISIKLLKEYLLGVVNENLNADNNTESSAGAVPSTTDTTPPTTVEEAPPQTLTTVDDFCNPTTVASSTTSSTTAKPVTAAPTTSSGATNQNTATESEEIDMGKKYFDPDDLISLYSIKGNSLNLGEMPYYAAVLSSDLYDSYEAYDNLSLFPFTLDVKFGERMSTEFYNKIVSLDAPKELFIPENSKYIEYINYKILKAIENFKPAQGKNEDSFFSKLKDISRESLGDLRDLIISLMAVGINETNVSKIEPAETLKDGSPSIYTFASWLVKNTQLFYVPVKLSELVKNIDDGIQKERNSGRLPYKNYYLQDYDPRTISADLFRYGLRPYKTDDYYLGSIKMTKYRAEFLRSMYDVPMRSISINMLLNPMYKLGNTFLFVSEHSANNKNTYLNRGMKNTLQDFRKAENEDKLNLVIRVDDLLPASGNESQSLDVPKYNVSLANKLTGISTGTPITKTLVLNHFSQALKFMFSGQDTDAIADSIPSDAYVPLLGIYNPTAPEVVKSYLNALIKFYATSNNSYFYKFNSSGKDNTFIKLRKNLQDALLDVYFYLYPNTEEFDVLKFNYLSNLLKPQAYHVYQYHINSLQHAWNFGATAKTNISGNFGFPAIMTYVPTTNNEDFSMHVLGYMLTKSPHMIYRETGGVNPIIHGDRPNFHPLYIFSAAQTNKEEEVYKSKYRYQVGSIFEKIRRKYLYPEIYGSLVVAEGETKQQPAAVRPEIADPIPIASKPNTAAPKANNSTPKTNTAAPNNTTGSAPAVLNEKQYEYTFNISRLSAYTAAPEETDDTPDTAACGPLKNVVGKGKTVIAVSRDLFFANGINGKKRFCGRTGKLVYTEGKFKGRVLDVVIYDTMNPRYKNTADVLFSSKTAAKDHGVQGGILYINYLDK